MELSFVDFITKTNIKQLVLEEYRKNRNDENLQVPTVVMHGQLEFYYEFRKRTREWQANCIKNLAYAHCKCTLDSGNATKSKKTDPSVVNQFQQEIMALSREAFINETNITEILPRNFHHEHLDYYEKLRYHPEKWHNTLLTQLKFKTCDCKRKKEFKEKSTATHAAVKSRDMQTQYDVNDFQSSAQSASHQHLLSISKVKCELDRGSSYRLGDDSDVILLDNEHPKSVVVEDDPSIEELFLQCDAIGSSTENSPTEDIITGDTQQSSEHNVK